MITRKLIRISTVPISLSLLLKGQLKYLNKYYQVVAVSSDGKELKEVEIRENVIIKPINIQRQISIYKDIVSLYKLYNLLKKEKPLIVHSITPKAGLLSMIAAKLARVPIRMHTFTGLIFPSKRGFLQYILIQMDKLLCKCATNIYPEGLGVKNDLVNFKVTSKPLKILGNGNVNGINTKYFDPAIYTIEDKEQLKRKLGINQEDFVFVFVGRLVSDKGINELVEVFDRLRINYMDIKLLLVGPEEKELDPLSERTLSAIDNNKGIISVGYQSDVRPYFAISDALVFPSYREGFPNVVMQAGAMGLPAIVTDINGCNEIIINHKNGTIIPVKDAGTLYQMMERYVADKEYVSGLKENAREMIASRYEQSMIWNALLEEYKSLEKACANNV